MQNLLDPVATNIHVKDGDVTFERVQDCTPIKEQSIARHNEGLHGDSEMKLAGSLPFVLVERYLNDNNIDFAEFMKNKEHARRMLNDPALAHFRVWKGRL